MVGSSVGLGGAVVVLVQVSGFARGVFGFAGFWV